MILMCLWLSVSCSVWWTIINWLIETTCYFGLFVKRQGKWNLHLEEWTAWRTLYHSHAHSKGKHQGQTLGPGDSNRGDGESKLCTVTNGTIVLGAPWVNQYPQKHCFIFLKNLLKKFRRKGDQCVFKIQEVKLPPGRCWEYTGKSWVEDLTKQWRDVA